MNRLLLALGVACAVALGVTRHAPAEEPETADGPDDVMFEVALPPPGIMPGGDRPGLMLPLLMRRADLSFTQRRAVRRVVQDEHRTLRGLFRELRQANDRLADKLLAPGPVGPSDLAAEIQRVSETRQRLMDQAVKTALAVRAVLTPEQLAKAAATKDRLRQLQAEMRTLIEGQ